MCDCEIYTWQCQDCQSEFSICPDCGEGEPDSGCEICDILMYLCRNCIEKNHEHEDYADDFEIEIDYDGIRHLMKQHGNTTLATLRHDFTNYDYLWTTYKGSHDCLQPTINSKILEFLEELL